MTFPLPNFSFVLDQRDSQSMTQLANLSNLLSQCLLNILHLEYLQSFSSLRVIVGYGCISSWKNPSCNPNTKHYRTRSTNENGSQLPQEKGAPARSAPCRPMLSGSLVTILGVLGLNSDCLFYQVLMKYSRVIGY